MGYPHGWAVSSPLYATPPPPVEVGRRPPGGGGGGDLIKKQTNANQRQCTPQSGISASLFSMPKLVKPQDTHCV